MRFRPLPSTPTAALFAALIIVSSLVPGYGSAQSGRVWLTDAWATMEPPAVWHHFYDLTQVPRPSHHEERATAFMAEFGRALELETIVDDAGNVLIRKPATPGMEGRPGVVLQAHLDMVAQKTPQSLTDFETDPINAFVEDGWVRADGTTLGADDGIGAAIIMALLEADDVVHGPLEALFTVNEEDGQTGIEALAPGTLRGRVYINLDNEVEGQFLISSAGGVNVDVRAMYDQVAPPPGMTGLRVTVDGLIGGHSGMDIDKGRGNAHQLLARLLIGAADQFDVRLADLAGGDLRNAIPRRATALVALPSNQAEAFGRYGETVGATIARELATSDPAVVVTVAPADLPETVMAADSQTLLIGAVAAAPQGIFRMSTDIPGLVESSANLGVLSIKNGQFTGGALVRSARDEEGDAEARRVADVFERAGATVEIGRAYPSWPPNPDSPALALLDQVYMDAFGTAPAVTAIHAGLETSVVGVTYPGMDMVSIGPTIQNVHSPDERLDAASVARVYDLLVSVLGQIERIDE